MAIISFSKTETEFLSGTKTVTRRGWSDHQFNMWLRMWYSKRLVNDAYNKITQVGGKKIGTFKLTERPYQERLVHMPAEDLVAEGAMCDSLEEYYRLIGKLPEDVVTVIRFKKI